MDEVNRLTTLRSAVELERKELERLHRIDVAATALDQLAQEYAKQQEQFETEMAAQRSVWEENVQNTERERKEQEEALKKERLREIDECEYKKNLERKRAEARSRSRLRLQPGERTSGVWQTVGSMVRFVSSLLAAARFFFRSRHDTAIETLTLRQQVAVPKRKRPRPKLSQFDRLFWRWRSRARGGRPRTTAEVRALIPRMTEENPTWGAPKIHGELMKVGFVVSERTAARYLRRVRRHGDPTKRWLAFHPQQRHHRRLPHQDGGPPAAGVRTASATSTTTG